MINWFKKHFIPHVGNDHRPHILRYSSIRNIIAIVLFIEIITFLGPVLTHLNIEGNMASVLPGVLANLTNEERKDENLAILNINETLNKAAEMKAKDMADYGYFAHTSPSGKTPWYWIEKVGYQYQYAGENLAINFTDSIDVTNAWMNSPSHKANITKENYTEVGTGIATGIYKGKEAVFVAQIYANPLQSKSKQIESKKLENTEKVAIAEEGINVLGSETEVATVENSVVVEGNEVPVFTKEPTFLQKAFASPRNTTNIILYIVFSIIMISLLLYIFIKMNNHHTDMLTNGLFVLVIIGAIFIGNHYLSYNNMNIAESYDYSLLNK